MQIPADGSLFYNELHSKLDEMKKTLDSLDPEKKGEGGLLTYREKENRFLPRSSFFQDWRYVQSAVNILDPEATCSHLIEGLEKVALQAQQIFSDINNLPKDSQINSRDLENIEKKLLSILDIINKKSNRCISQLTHTYGRQGKEIENIKKIQATAHTIFSTLQESEKLTFEKISLDHLKDELRLDREKILQEFSSRPDIGFLSPDRAAAKIVESEFTYKENLTGVSMTDTGVVVPSSLVKDSRNDRKLKKLTSKKSIQQANNTQEPFKRALPLTAPDGKAIWFSLEIIKEKEKIEIQPDKAIPTSLRDPLNEQGNHLTNFKVQINEDTGHISISCGCIDTKTKADEFIAGLLFALEKRPSSAKPIPLRIVLHQLNSFYTDKNLIPKQHALSRYIEDELRHHITPEYAKIRGIKILDPQIPILGHINSSLNFASTLYKEDAQSNKQNLDGLAAETIWVLEDLAGKINPMIITDSSYRELANSTFEIMRLHKQIADTKNRITDSKKEVAEYSPHLKELQEVEERIGDIQKNFELEMENPDDEETLQFLKIEHNELEKQASLEKEKVVSTQPIAQNLKLLEKELGTLQNQLNSKLQAFVKFSQQLEKKLTSIADSNPQELDCQNMLMILNLLLAKQTGSLPKEQMFSRNQEIELFLLLDMHLGCVSEFNCKSGLDRTGLVRSTWDSLRAKLNQFSEEFLNKGQSPELAQSNAYQKLFTLIINQDTFTDELDQIQIDVINKSQLKEQISSSLEELENKIPLEDNIRTLVVNEIRKRYSSQPEKVEGLINALSYQDLIAANLLSVAQVITLESTGGPGLKYGHDSGLIATVSANPHPLKRLPMFVTTDNGKTLQLYTVSVSTIGDEDLFRGFLQRKHFFTSGGMDLFLRNSQIRGD